MNSIEKSQSDYIATANRACMEYPWPESELEAVPACPVCGSAERSVLEEGLIDNVFFVAPGKWTLHSCSQCRSAYLDPRPSQFSIGKAYGNYYTHVAGANQPKVNNLGFFRRLRRMMSNDYLNHRYGTQRSPSLILGRWVAQFLPEQKQKLDAEFRYLPKPTLGQRLLDIGCGNGSFLVSARDAGWQVAGLEPDPKAAWAARKLGVDVTSGTIEALAGDSNCFDAITLSHVIEHVHEPAQLLQAAHRLLKPGGSVFIDTPNIQSYGASFFKNNWRGLETPRHLVLFNPDSLGRLLADRYFIDIKFIRRTAVWQGTFLKSLRMAAGFSPYSRETMKLSWMWRIRMNSLFIATNRLEFVTLTARKKSI